MVAHARMADGSHLATPFARSRPIPLLTETQKGQPRRAQCASRWLACIFYVCPNVSTAYSNSQYDVKYKRIGGFSRILDAQAHRLKPRIRQNETCRTTYSTKAERNL